MDGILNTVTCAVLVIMEAIADKCASLNALFVC